MLQGGWRVPGTPRFWWGGAEGLESLGEGVLAPLGAVAGVWLIWW